MLERTVFNGYLKPLFLKATTIGYDFAKPFGDDIARGLRSAGAREIWQAAFEAMLATPDYLEKIAADHNTVIRVETTATAPFDLRRFAMGGNGEEDPYAPSRPPTEARRAAGHHC